MEFVGTIEEKRHESKAVIVFTLRDETGIVKVKMIDPTVKQTGLPALRMGTVVRAICNYRRTRDPSSCIGIKMIPLLEKAENEVFFTFIFFFYLLFFSLYLQKFVIVFFI
jgi:hypothetical protein